MPQTSESISVISIYLMVVLATSCLSVLSSVLVLSIHHQRGRPSRAPLWLRRLCFSLVARLLHLVQIRDTYATEFGQSKPTSHKKKTRFESSVDDKPCCYSNCRSPDRVGSRLETHFATGRCRIANSNPDGYIEMRSQIRHDCSGCGAAEGEAKFNTKEYNIVFSSNQCRNQTDQHKLSAASCQCYTSRVYVPPRDDINTGHNLSNTDTTQRPSAYSALRCVQQENAIFDFKSNSHQFSDGRGSASNLQPAHDPELACNTQSCAERDISSHVHFPSTVESAGGDPGSVCHHAREIRGKAGLKDADIEVGQSADNENSCASDGDESPSNNSSDSEENSTSQLETSPPAVAAEGYSTNSTGIHQQVTTCHAHLDRNDPPGRKRDATLPMSAPAPNLNQPSHNATYRTILRYLLSLVQIRQEQEVTEVKDEELYKEWHDLAFVLDRLLFYLFFFVTLGSTVGILEMRPESEPL
ncbi:hypothetical protein RRG08_050935 [Elysia crispata]|nr:hypothetical protein RRG08_050935 [Elysia crispata]KAK3754272.1 hypothetical protein RRG08_050935 [Elysia crispata]